MKKLPIGLLSLLVVSVPGLSHAQSVSAQKAPACVSPYGSQAVLASSIVPLSGEGQGPEMAELAIAFLKAGQPQRAAQVNRQIQSRFKIPAERMALLSMIQTMAAGNPEAALPQLAKLQLDPDAANVIFAQVLEMPESQQTQWILKAVDRASSGWGSGKIKLNWLVDLAQQQQNRGGKADPALLEKARVASQISQESLQSEQLFSLIKLSEAYRRNGDLQTARSLLDSALRLIKSNGVNPTQTLFAWMRVAQQYARAGQPERALSELQTIHDFVKRESMLNDGNLVRDLSLAYAAAGKLNEALALVELLKNDPDYTRSDIAQQYAELGEMRLGQQVFDMIRDRYAKDRAALGIAKQLNQRSQFEAALPFAQKITNDYERRTLIATIAYKANQANQQEVRDRAVKSLYPNYTIAELKDAADALIQVGYLSRAKTLLLEAVALAIETRSQWQIPAIAPKFAAVGDPARATQLLDEQFAALERAPRNPIQDTLPIAPLPFLLETDFRGRTGVQQFFFYNRMVRTNPPVPSLTIPAPPSKLKQLQTPKLPNLTPPKLQSNYDVKAIDDEKFARHYSQARNFTKANALIQRIPNKYCNFKANVILHFVSEAVQAGHPQMASNALAKVPRTKDYQASVRENLLAIANLYLNQQQPTKAIPLLEQALNLSQK